MKYLGGLYCHPVVRYCNVNLRAAWTEDTFLQCSWHVLVPKSSV